MNKYERFLVIVITVLSLFTVQSQGFTFLVTDSTQLQNALNTARTNGEDDKICLIEGTYTASTGRFLTGRQQTIIIR